MTKLGHFVLTSKATFEDVVTMAEESPVTPKSPSSTYVASFSRASRSATISGCDDSPPFEKWHQLCKDLEYTRGCEKPAVLRSNKRDQTLPDAPRIPLDSCRLVLHCLEDLDTPDMNKFDRKLWWCGPNPYIKTLSEQLTFERRIVVTERPELHLVCTENNMIYVKPLPAYLCSYAFWEYLLDSANDGISLEERERLRATSLGFLRTYATLIKHRSDFNIARRYDLLSSFGPLSFEAFVQFISSFDSVPDKAISVRWRFGEISLGAINFHSALHYRRWHFNRFESSYSTYFQRFFPVTLFLFAAFSVVLSAMQVILAGRQLWETDNSGLKTTLSLFEWFGCEAIGWSLGFGVIYVVWWVWMAVAEGVKMKRIKRMVKKRQKEEGVLSP